MVLKNFRVYPERAHPAFLTTLVVLVSEKQLQVPQTAIFGFFFWGFRVKIAVWGTYSCFLEKKMKADPLKIEKILQVYPKMLH